MTILKLDSQLKKTKHPFFFFGMLALLFQHRNEKLKQFSTIFVDGALKKHILQASRRRPLLRAIGGSGARQSLADSSRIGGILLRTAHCEEKRR